MLEKIRFRIKLMLLLFSFANLCASYGQVSLLPEHTITIDGISDSAGNKISYNVIRDSKNASKWYYVPVKPRLLERNPSSSADPKPSFQLFTYQSQNNSEFYEGGILQFAVSMAISEKEKKQLVETLKKRPESKNSGVITVAPLPYHKAEATLYDAGGNRSAEAPQAPGLAPAFVTGSLPFQLKLNKFGTDLYSALIDKKNSGVGVLMVLSFEGVLPPAGFKITVDWDQTFKHISKSTETKIAIGTFFCGAEISNSKTKIREELISNQCIKVESLTNEVVTDESIDRYLEPVLARIYKELIEKIQPPESIEPEKHSKPDFIQSCFFPLSIGTSVIMKDVNIVKKGTETIEFNQSVIVERKTACGAFIGINSYSEDLKKSLVRVMPLNSWASAFLLLPGVDNSPELHINSVSMTANVVDSKGNPVPTLSDTASWASDYPLAWKNKEGNDASSLKFPLLALFDKHKNNIEAIRKEYQFKVDVVIEQKLANLNTIRTSYLTPLFDGDLPLAAPVDLVDNIIFDASLLNFDSVTGLKKLKILVNRNRTGEKAEKLEFTLPQRGSEERSVVFIVEAEREGKATEKLIPAVIFTPAKGARKDIAWAQNGKNLREVDSSLYFLLFDSDWEKP